MTDRVAPLETSAARLDVALVGAGLFESRAKAQEAIAAGLVSVDGLRASKPSLRIAPDARLKAEAPYPWVSRGGVKLAAALDRFGLDPSGFVCLDIGASTGGFTDVLLTRNAALVYAVDVGHDQLHLRLRSDPRVIDLSSTDARHLDRTIIDRPPGLIVCDASFISLTLIVPPVLALAAPDAAMIALVKPQFEVGPGRVVKGIVKDESMRTRACASVAAVVSAAGWDLLGLHPSPITGADGNIEYLLGARRR